jgi:hypothetical protein
MKLVHMALLTLIAACFASMAALPAPTAPHNALYARAKATTHYLVEESITSPPMKCGATAIGPHALLTASHCEQPSDVIEIDNVSVALVAHPLRDYYDHTIYLVDTTFPLWAKFSDEPVEQGDQFFYFGNCGPQPGLFRMGYVAAIQPSEELGGPAQLVLDTNAYYGDSGAALFDKNGNIMGVVSRVGSFSEQNNPVNAKFAYSWQLGFTKEELAMAVK